MNFRDANARYEDDLRSYLGGALVAQDLDEKHRKMRKSAFLFLRATCFRWAGMAAILCPELMAAQAVGSVGDAHAGNFGLWRDAQSRLVWGINDYDEAAVTPWPLDLVRLTVSLMLAQDGGDAGGIADAVLEGYAQGLRAPSAFVLEHDHMWLRHAFSATDAERADFWHALKAAPPAPCDPPSFEAPLRHALGAAQDIRISARSAGVGSLGRPRFVASGTINSGPAAAEIKAFTPSSWAAGRAQGLAERLAHGRYRSPDASHHYATDHVVRRLAPNNRKLDFDALARALHAPLFAAMAADIAAIHADAGAPGFLDEALKAMPAKWLKHAAKRVADWTAQEWKDYRMAD